MFPLVLGRPLDGRQYSPGVELDDVGDPPQRVIPSGPSASSRDFEPAVTSAFASSVNWFPVKIPTGDWSHVQGCF